MTQLYNVVIKEEAMLVYIVSAHTEKEAEDKAQDRYEDGEEPEDKFNRNDKLLLVEPANGTFPSVKRAANLNELKPEWLSCKGTHFATNQAHILWVQYDFDNEHIEWSLHRKGEPTVRLQSGTADTIENAKAAVEAALASVIGARVEE